MTRLDPALLAGLLSYVLGHSLSWVARRRGWTDEQKRHIPQLVGILGAVAGYAIAALLDGGTWHDALLGGLAGWAAVGLHESVKAVKKEEAP